MYIPLLIYNYGIMSHPIDQIIKDRRTSKAIGDIDHPISITDSSFIKAVNEIVTVAGSAPYHKPANAIHLSDALPSPVPWRFYVLDSQGCNQLLTTLKDWGTEDSFWIRGKIPAMLAAGGALIQATWLPEPTSTNLPYEPNLQNTEHIAAASAAIQNLLLAATGRGIPTYWSSGGTLRDPKILAHLGIPANQHLLGSIFLFPDTTNAEVFGGKQREKREAGGAWTQWVTL